MSDMAITTDGLVKHYREVRAVDGLTMRVPRGSVYGFLGRNGAGKTSTIKMLLGLTHLTGGSAQVLGLDIRRDKVAILERTAFVSENKTLYAGLTPAELVRFTRAFYRTWSDDAVKKYARLFEIPMNQLFRKLSHGNRTKVYLLLALCQGADLLILDEPTSGLDPVMIDQLLRVLVGDAASEGRTVFFSSHQLSEVEQIAEWVGIIDRGKLRLEARLEDIKSEFRLITASGDALPTERSSQVISAVPSGKFCQYVVARDAEAFAAQLRQQGAAVAEISALNLREIFLELVRKEESCTSGSVGATSGVASSSF